MFRFQPFLDHLRSLQRAPATIREYRYALCALEHDLSRLGILDDRAVTGEHVAAFLDGLRERLCSDDYPAKVAGLLKAYFAFLEDGGLILSSPMAGCKTKRPGLGHFPAVGHTALTAMLDAVGGDDPISVRGRAILELAYSSALRPREIRHLKLADIDHQRGLLFIEQSKGRKDRLVPVGRTALARVKRYISEVRPRYARSDNEYFFVSHRDGRGLSVKGLRWAVQEALRRAGRAPIKPASLRCSAATALMEAGMDVSYIQRLLGHADVRTTLIYLRVSQRALESRLADIHPRQKWSQQASRRSKTRRNAS